MSITQKELAERLRKARKHLELTQEEVATRLGMKRTTVVQIEAGMRAVTSIELADFALLYKSDLSDFLNAGIPGEGSVSVLLRATADLNDEVRAEIEKCAVLCKRATSLEKRLGRPTSGIGPFTYTIERPQSRWEAVDQGIRLAQMERKRLGLGALPVRNIVEIIALHGVRVARHPLPKDIAGVFFCGHETGTAILVNENHEPTRRLFSYVHEYGHLLADRLHMQSGISRFSNREDLIEVRANAFAAHFLMPEEGVRANLRSAGHGETTRQVMEIYDGYKEQAGTEAEELVTAQRRAAPGSQEVQMLDALRLSRHFGTSYDAAVYQLLNLKIIQKDEQAALMQDRHRVEGMTKLLGGLPPIEGEDNNALKMTIIELTLDALLNEVIGLPVARENLELIGEEPGGLDQFAPEKRCAGPGK